MSQTVENKFFEMISFFDLQEEPNLRCKLSRMAIIFQEYFFMYTIHIMRWPWILGKFLEKGSRYSTDEK